MSPLKVFVSLFIAGSLLFAVGVALMVAWLGLRWLWRKL